MAKRTYWRVSALFLGIFSWASGLEGDAIGVTAVASGNWSNPSIWSPAVVPNNAGGTTYGVNLTSNFLPPFFRSVTVDISPTVSGVGISDNTGTGGRGASLEILNDSTLTAGGVSVQAGPMSVAGLAVDSGGVLNANRVGLSGRIAYLGISGTATIRSVFASGEFTVGSGGLANDGTFSGGYSNTVASGGTLNIASRSVTFSGMSVNGTLTLGTGNLLPLASQNTLVNNGQIVVEGGVPLALFIGSSPNPECGCLFVAGNATYDEVIDSATSFGTIAVFGISLNGTLDITLANSYIPPVGQRFTIISGQGTIPLSGTFANIEGQTFNNGTEMWNVTYESNAVVLTAEPAAGVVPEPSLVMVTGLALAGIVTWTCRRRRGASPSRRVTIPESLRTSDKIGRWIAPRDLPASKPSPFRFRVLLRPPALKKAASFPARFLAGAIASSLCSAAGAWAKCIAPQISRSVSP